MNISENGLELIKSFEGFRAKPYLCQAGVPTIGYGSTRYLNGSKVKLTDNPISKTGAENLLKYKLFQVYEPAVDRYVQIEMTQNQYDALVSFTYNLGTEALRTSTLLKCVNQGKIKEAAEEFKKWVFADGEVSPGLIKRREKESKLFLS